MDFNLYEVPLREPDKGRGEPRLSLFLVGRGKRNSYLPVPEFTVQLNEVLEQLGLGHVSVSSSDLIFALRSRNLRALERKRRPKS